MTSYKERVWKIEHSDPSLTWGPARMIYDAGHRNTQRAAAEIAAEADREIAELREALAAIIYHEERGQGVGYKEAIERAADLINRSAS